MRAITLLGFRMKVHPSWLFALGLIVIWLLSAGGPPLALGAPEPIRWLAALAAAALFFLSVVVHELAHAVAARSQGIPVSEVTLHIFGGTAALEQDPPSARAEALAAVAGPVASASLGGILLLLGAAFVSLGPGPLQVLAELGLGLGTVNLLLALVNLVPAFPMDGGRILRGAIWAVTRDPARATSVATGIGRAASLMVVGGGLLTAAVYDLLLGLWVAIIGYFLFSAARASRRRAELSRMVSGVSIRDVMDPGAASINPNLTLDTFVDQSLMGDGNGFFPVTVNDELVGSIDLRQVRRVRRSLWPQTRVADVMSRLEALWTLTEPQPALDAINRFSRSNTPAIVVVAEDDPRRLVGLVTRDRLMSVLRHREALRAD